MKTLKNVSCFVFFMLFVLQALASADLEKAIYLENTVGDLREAQAEYEKVIAKHADDSDLMYLAKLGLLRCYVKTGRVADAKRLLSEMSETDLPSSLAAEYKQFRDLTLGMERQEISVPWQNGEYLRYRTLDKFNNILQHHVVTRNRLERNKRPVWHTFTSIWNNYGLGQTVVHEYSDIVGDGSEIEVYSGRELVMNATRSTKRVSGAFPKVSREFDHVIEEDIILDHDLINFMRESDLTQGEVVERKGFSIAMNSQIDIKISVSEKLETVKTPAGSFDCFKITLQIKKNRLMLNDETHWLTADERKLPIKSESKIGVTELVSVKPLQPSNERYEQTDLPFTFELPEGWMAGVAKGGLGNGFPTIIVKLDRSEFVGMVYINGRSIALNDEYTVRDSIYWSSKWFEENRKGFQLDQDSIAESSLGDLPTVQYWSEYLMVSTKLSEFRYTIATDKLEVSFIFHGEKGKWEHNMDKIETLIGTIKQKN